jgi:crotonobetainyl-CoA:carnitine CoA-transferase CaiB-like acyl-CoA transferase
MAASAPSDHGSLHGITVLDLSRLLPGGFCSQLLADHGADVIKVEDVGRGDYARWLPPLIDTDEPSVGSPNFVALNRNKRSIRINLKNPAGRAAFLRLVTRADVVLESFRPGVMERLGLDYATLKATNKQIIHCGISGYGQDGAYSGRAGHDLNYLALAGILGMSRHDDGRPVQAGVQIADLSGAMMATVGILTALHERTKSGEGQSVDTSMAHSVLSWLVLAAANALATGEFEPPGSGLLTGGAVCYRPYACSDGWVTIAALEDKFWTAWCEGVGRGDLIAHQFDPPGSEAHREIEHVFAQRTRAEWTACSERWDCCVEPVLGLDEALSSPLVRSRGMLVELDQPGGPSPARTLGVPLLLSRTPGDAHRHPAPALGEHTEEVLRDADFSEQEAAALLAEGAVKGRDAA